MNFGVIVFPGVNCDLDTLHVLREVLGQEARLVWHRETRLEEFDALILPGGFAHGDYLRAGAIARFSPVMEAVRRHAERGRPVLGICNGFQVLLEAGLLPGAMLRNAGQRFICRPVRLRVEATDPTFLAECRPGDLLTMPIAHGEGCYYCDERTLAEMEHGGQILLRYCDAAGRVTSAANPNGSLGNIAGIRSASGRVMGLMPHPERASEALLGSDDGLRLLRSLTQALTPA